MFFFCIQPKFSFINKKSVVIFVKQFVVAPISNQLIPSELVLLPTVTKRMKPNKTFNVSLPERPPSLCRGIVRGMIPEIRFFQDSCPCISEAKKITRKKMLQGSRHSNYYTLKLG